MFLIVPVIYPSCGERQLRICTINQSYCRSFDKLPPAAQRSDSFCDQAFLRRQLIYFGIISKSLMLICERNKRLTALSCIKRSNRMTSQNRTSNDLPKFSVFTAICSFRLSDSLGRHWRPQVSLEPGLLIKC